MPPFVIATRYPKGAAVLLTALGRTTPVGWSEPAADIELAIPSVDVAEAAAAAGGGTAAMPVIGLMGHFASVTLVFEPACFGNNSVAGRPRVGRKKGEAAAGEQAEEEAAAALEVMARDMIGQSEEKLTPAEATWLNANTLKLDGAALRRLGTAARSRDDDVSAPGVVLRIGAAGVV